MLRAVGGSPNRAGGSAVLAQSARAALLQFGPALVTNGQAGIRRPARRDHVDRSTLLDGLEAGHPTPHWRRRLGKDKVFPAIDVRWFAPCASSS
jgi:hypothetical protein